MIPRAVPLVEKSDIQRLFLQRVLYWRFYCIRKNQQGCLAQQLIKFQFLLIVLLITKHTIMLLQAVIASSLMPGYGGINGLPLIRGKVRYSRWKYCAIRKWPRTQAAPTFSVYNVTLKSRSGLGPRVIHTMSCNVSLHDVS